MDEWRQWTLLMCNISLLLQTNVISVVNIPPYFPTETPQLWHDVNPGLGRVDPCDFPQWFHGGKRYGKSPSNSMVKNKGTMVCGFDFPNQTNPLIVISCYFISMNVHEHPLTSINIHLLWLYLPWIYSFSPTLIHQALRTSFWVTNSLWPRSRLGISFLDFP